MDFAKNLMKKYGWEEGKGLGKNSEGIVKPLKASLKFDTSGLGVDKAEEFNNHWWERVFNEAANNIDIKKSKENVSIETKDDEAVEISTKNFSIKKLKKLKCNEKHENFIKSSILKGSNNDEEIFDKIDTDVVKFQQFKTLTDDELFAACGGRTAHKGARHGLNLSGKLSRIQEQEKELLSKMYNNNPQPQNNIKDTEMKDDWNLVTSKKKRKLKTEDKITNEGEIDELSKNLYSAEYYCKSKKKKKKNKKIENELIAVMNCAKVTEDSSRKNDVEMTANIVKNSKKIKKSKLSSNNENDNEEINNTKNIQSKSLSPPLDIAINSFDGSLKVHETENSNRFDKVYKKKFKKNKERKTNDGNISKCEEYKRKKKLKKSLKNISENVETFLTIS